MVRILQIINTLSKGAGAIETTINYYKNIQKDKIQFDFFVLNKTTNSYHEEISELGGKIYYANSKKLTKIKKQFIEIINLNKYEIIELQIPTYSFLFLKQAKKLNVPIRICHTHSCVHSSNYIKNLISKTLNSNIKNYATHFWSCSDESGKYWFGDDIINNKNYSKIINYVNLNDINYNSDFREKIRKEMNINDKIVLGYLGRISKDKNVDFLLKILKKIDDKYILLMVGSGRYLKKFKKKIETQNLSNRIILVGYQKNIGDWLSVMDLFVFPSISEGLGMALVEAQKVGLTSICFDSIPKDADVGLLEYVNSKNINDWIKIIKKCNFKNQDINIEKYNTKNNTKILEEKYFSFLESE